MRHIFIFALLSFASFSPIAKGMMDSNPYDEFSEESTLRQAPGRPQEMPSRENPDDDGFVFVERGPCPEPRELHAPSVERRKAISIVIKNGQHDRGGINAIALGVIAKYYQAFFPYDENFESLQQFPHDFVASIKGYHANIDALARPLYSLSRYFNASSIASYHRLCTSVITNRNKRMGSRLPVLDTLFPILRDDTIRQLVTYTVLSSQARDEGIAERALLLAPLFIRMPFTDGGESLIELPEDFPFELLGEETRRWNLNDLLVRVFKNEQ